MMIEKMLIGATILLKKFFGKIWNNFKNLGIFWMKDSPIKNAVVRRKAKNVDHPA